MTAMTALGGYADLLRSALSHVEADVPEAFARFAGALEDHTLTLQVEHERFAIVRGAVRHLDIDRPAGDAVGDPAAVAAEAFSSPSTRSRSSIRSSVVSSAETALSTSSSCSV